MSWYAVVAFFVFYSLVLTAICLPRGKLVKWIAGK